MKDTTVLARCNLFAILGAIPHLLALDPKAAAIVADKKIKIGFAIHGGPSATLAIENGKASMYRGTKGCSIKLYFSSPEKFNAMIEGKANPLPVSGFQHIAFLTHEFTALTDLLTAYLRPAPERLEDPVFFERSTTLMLYVIGRAVVQIGNHDKVGRFSASNITDGKIILAIGRANGPAIGPAIGNGGREAGRGLAVAVHAKSHHLLFNANPTPDHVTSSMSFADLHVARDLFDGRINAIAAVGLGHVRVGGMVSQVDNVNRILDRVSLYLT